MFSLLRRLFDGSKADDVCLRKGVSIGPVRTFTFILIFDQFLPVNHTRVKMTSGIASV